MALLNIKSGVASNKYRFDFDLPKGSTLMKDYDYSYDEL